MAVDKESNSVDNSQQHFNLMGQVSQIIPADNSSNIDVSQTVETHESLVHSETVAIRTNWEGKAYINKYVSNSSEKTTDNKAARLKRQREHKRKLRNNPAYAKRQRERYRNDLAFVERHKQRQKERQRELRKDPAYAKHRREQKKQHCQSVNSAETTQSSSKNSEGTAPRFSVIKLKESLQSQS